MSEFSQTLLSRVEEWGLGLSPKQAALCEDYYHRVTQANTQLNLTRITGQVQAAQQHFADAMRLCAVYDAKEGSSVIDIGTGAGFPGVPLLILRPDLKMTLLDASGKKTDFIRHALGAMKLDAKVICARAEELGRSALRGTFDMAVSRAVAPLPMLLELSVPLLKSGGVLAAWKGEHAAQELENATGAMRELYCAVKASHPVGEGALLLIQKQKPTPEAYPRRFSKIKSHPL